MTRGAAILLILACAAAACGKRQAAHPADAAVSRAAGPPDAAPPPPIASEELAAIEEASPHLAPGEFILMAKPASEAAPVPARYAAPIARPPAPIFGDVAGAPPMRHVVDEVCLGDAQVRARFIEALDRVRQDRDPEDDLDGYGFWLEECKRGDACAWAAKAAAAHKAGYTRGFLWHLAPTCADPLLVPLFAGPDVPVASIHDLYFNLWLNQRKAPYLPALGTALHAELERRAGFDPGDDPTDSSIVYIAQSMTYLDDPRAEAALLAAWEAEKRPIFKRSLAVGVAGASDPRLARIHAEACRDPLLVEACAEADDDIARRRPALPKDLDAAISEGVLAVAAVAAKGPRERAAILSALGRCVRDEDPVGWCLGSLAEIDWAAARQQAARLQAVPKKRREENGWSDDPGLAELTHQLTAQPGLDALVARLRQLGLIAAGPLSEDHDAGAAFYPGSTRRLLARGGRVLEIDSDAEFFPVPYDHLLRRLAALAGPDLAGVVFEQVAPPKAQKEVGAYTVMAYAGGQRLSLRFLGGDTNYRLQPPLAFFNAVLAARGSPLRAVDISSDSGELAVLVAPETGIRKAVAEKLLVLPLGEAEEPEEEE